MCEYLVWICVCVGAFGVYVCLSRCVLCVGVFVWVCIGVYYLNMLID